MTNLYTKTAYSFLKSNIRIDELVQKAKENGFTSLGIADDNLHAAFKFYKKCMQNSIKPIIGLDIEVSNTPFLLYAKNLTGYKELMRISSQRELTESIHLSELNPEGLIIITKGDYLDYDFEALDRFDYYMGIQLDDLDLELNFAPKIVEKADELNKKCIAIPKVLYLESNDYKYVQALEAIQKGEVLTIDAYTVGNQYLRVETDYTELYSEYPQCLITLDEVVDSIQLNLEYGDYQLPKYPTEHDSKDYLAALCKRGLEKRVSTKEVDTKTYIDRLVYELKMIDELGFNDYFLIVWDFVNYAKKNDILVGPGRGSAAGSLVSYCLGITNTDPIEYDLLFERFLNPARKTMPDIDMDFPDDKRDLIIEYVMKKYSLDNVSSIVTFGTFAGRSAIRDVAKILNLRDEYLDEVLKHIPINASNLNKLMLSKELSHLRSNFRDIEQLLDYASHIEGLPRHTSTHAAGIIITDKPIQEYSAVQRGLGGIYQTQYEAKDLEEIGLLKIDFLGLSNLKILKNTVDMVKEYEGVDINLYDLTFDDADVFKLLREGDTDGVFQLESRGVRDVLRRLKVSEFEDIVATTALYRPGPMDNIPEYIKRKLANSTEYVHPDLESILESTYGIIIYQEQIIMIANQFAGYTLSEADLLRRAVSKKEQDVLEKERVRFVSKCVEQNHSEDVANQIYDYIVKFANYGFNRSHSVAYAMVAYQCAYMKVKYPRYFFAVLLSHSVGSEKSTEKYIRECRKYGIEIVSPDINTSKNTYTISEKSIQLPFLSIKNLGRSTAKKIIEERQNGEFKDYLDFVSRTKGILSKALVEKLIYSSALDSFGLNKRTMIEKYEDALKFMEYGNLIKDITFDFGDSEEFELDELIDFERLALGFNVKFNFMRKYQSIITKNDLDSLADREYKTPIKFIARINKVKRIVTKNGKEMAFVTLEDDTSVVDSVIFPQEFVQYDKMLSRGEVCLFSAKMERNKDRNSLIISKVGVLK